MARPSGVYVNNCVAGRMPGLCKRWTTPRATNTTFLGVDEQSVAVEEELDLARDHVEGLGRAVVDVRLLQALFCVFGRSRSSNANGDGP
jgi:hypothetical protein